MRQGSKIRSKANTHMLLQFSAAAIFVVDFILRWPHRHDMRSSFAWIVLDVLGALIVTIGADFGGQMVYKMGFRVE